MIVSDFRLLMIGAMYENGGNTTHRFLDGHPQMFVYPFESQLGTRYVNDMLSSMFPLKYRWPVFPLDATPDQDYHAIIDEECKVRARTPHVSKFRQAPFEFDDDERRRCYGGYVRESGRSTANNVAAFFRATFDAWKDYQRTGREAVYVGYSPIITVDTERILRDLPAAHVLHVVRNPWSAFADTSKRPVPLSLENYMLAWTLNQYYALLFQAKYPSRVHVVRIEDVMRDSQRALAPVCEKLDLESPDTLKQFTWNGREMKEVYPWGTIRTPTPEANLVTARELTPAQIGEIRARARPYLEAFDYQSFLGD
ncbi:MAG TPA: sulfotransferase [Bryobacteraceae bacterium]|nr:sulfotransferase [Bryobacteraceae bacterium]